MSSEWCSFDHLRIPGVLQRLAICYGICAMLTLYVKPKGLIAISVSILISYAFLLYFFNGYEWSENNIISKIDHYILGANHLYSDNGIKLDPEGILSTLPSVAHVLFAECLMFEWMKVKSESEINSFDESGNYFAWKSFAKYVLNISITIGALTVIDTFDTIPIIKKVWSTTFVLTTVSIASLLLTGLIWVVDIKKYCGIPCKFFIVFGHNPLLMYIISWILADWFGHWGITWNVYQYFCHFMSPSASSLFYALFFVMFNWIIALFLYKSRIRFSA